MSEKPRRRFWQFHLLTLVLMALAAGGMLLLGIKVPAEVRRSVVQDPTLTLLGDLKPEDAESDPDTQYFRTENYGWPDPFLQITAPVKAQGGKWIPYLDDFAPITNLLWPNLVGDLIIAIGCLGAAAFLSESILRRREARKT
jgi:hypothetical protein